MDLGGGSNEDDLTVKLQEILDVNASVKAALDNGANVKMIMENWDFLQVGGGSGSGGDSGGGRGADRGQSEQQSGVRDRLLRGAGSGHRSFAPVPTYELYAVCNHMGGLQGGHYTAHCRSRIGGGGAADEWHTFDDARVGPTNTVRVGGTSAYVLFFRLSSPL